MKMIFNHDAYEKVRQLVTQCPQEITGLGKIEIIEKDVLLVTDIAIFKQEVTAGSCELDKDKLMEFVSERVREPYRDAGMWRLWWHSHATMGCFWSGTDTSNIERMGETADWMASVVFNHKMEYKARLDMWKPFTIGDINMEVTIKYPETDGIVAWAKKEIADKVNERTFKRPIGYATPYTLDDDDYGKKDFPILKDSKGKKTKELTAIEEINDNVDKFLTDSDEEDYSIGYIKEWEAKKDALIDKILLNEETLSDDERKFVKENWDEFRGLYA